MNPNIPNHLRRLLKEVPDDYEYIDQIYVRGEHLLFRRNDRDQRGSKRSWRYWRRATGEEVIVKFYPNNPSNLASTGILTGILEKGSRSIILGGRDPNAQRQFKMWHGVSARLHRTQGGPSLNHVVDNSIAGAFPSPERSSHSMSPAVKVEDDDDIQMLDAAPVAPARAASCAAKTPPFTDNLQVSFQSTRPNLPSLFRRWAMCNAIRKLFSQTLVLGVLNRDDSMNGLLVEIKTGGESSVEGFAIAEGDEDTFNSLCVGLTQAVRGWGLKGTMVEVSRI